MSNKWDSSRKEEATENARVVLFVSRNKDNKDILGFKERRYSFLTSRKPEELKNDFDYFVSEGNPGEMCRFYMSVNTRDLKKIKKALIHKLIDSDTAKELLKPESCIVGIAALKKNALTKHWLLDVDTKDPLVLSMIRSVISPYTDVLGEAETPNGHHIVTEHGFDTRRFSDAFPQVTIKRDDMALISWKTKENS